MTGWLNGVKGGTAFLRDGWEGGWTVLGGAGS